MTASLFFRSNPAHPDAVENYILSFFMDKHDDIVHTFLAKEWTQLDLRSDLNLSISTIEGEICVHLDPALYVADNDMFLHLLHTVNCMCCNGNEKVPFYPFKDVHTLSIFNMAAGIQALYP